MLQLHIEQTEERKDLIELGSRIREQREGAGMSQAKQRSRSLFPAEPD